MSLNLKLQPKLTQQLVLTPQLQLSIKILQLNHLELRESIEQEMEVNPLLDIKEDIYTEDKIPDLDFEKFMENYSKIKEEFIAKDKFNLKKNSQEDDESNVWENFVSKKPNLCDHLLWQLHLENFSAEHIQIGEEIIGNIDPDGYIRISPEEIAGAVGATCDDVELVLRRIQHFDPVGIGSRNLRECLLNQIDVYGCENALVRVVVDRYLDDLSRKNLKKIAKELAVSIDAVEGILKYINSLNPKPGSGFEFSAFENQQIEPDVFVSKDGQEYIVTLNYDGMPYVRINKQYEIMLKNKNLDPATREFLKEKIKAAYWFIKSIHQRGSTIVRVAKAIIDRQREFFDKGVSFMKPLTLRDLADVLELHESTISRVTSNKYMLTPSGLFEMKYFFGSGIRKVGGDDVSSITVKEIIKVMVDGENHKSPLSDQEISDMLKAKGYNIARRTITKYREFLGILPSNLRKK